MKRLFMTAIGLMFALTMLLPFATAAASGPDAQPVSWVSWKANLTPKLCEKYLGYEDHIWENLLVKKLSDGTIVGHIEFKYMFSNTSGYCKEITSAEFTGNTVVVQGLFVDPAWGGTFENPIQEIYTLVDGGEPAIGNDMIGIQVNTREWGWISLYGPSITVPIVDHQNIQIHNGD